MTSIPVAICRFSDNNFKRFYLKNENLFDCISEHSETKGEYPSLFITEIIASEIDVPLSV